jgi:hypothetical protein
VGAFHRNLPQVTQIANEVTVTQIGKQNYRRQPTSTTSRPAIATPTADFDRKSPSHRSADSRLRPQVARPSQRRQPTSTASRPAIAAPSADFDRKSPSHRSAVSRLRPQVARPSQRRQPTSTASRPAIAAPSADFDHKSPGHRSAVSRLRPQVARCLCNQPPTSNIKKLHFKLRITQVMYLQSVSIKAYTIYNRVLIVARAPQITQLTMDPYSSIIKVTYNSDVA